MNIGALCKWRKFTGKLDFDRSVSTEVSNWGQCQQVIIYSFEIAVGL